MNPIQSVLSVSQRTINSYLTEIDQQLRKERKEKIFSMWLACATQEEIAEAVNLPQQTLNGLLPKMEEFPNSVKLSATFQDSDFTPPIYNVWTFAKKQKLGHEAVNYGAEIKLRAARQMGEVLEETPKATGGQPYQNGKSTGSTVEPVDTLDKIGLTKKQSSQFQQIACHPYPPGANPSNWGLTILKMSL